MAISELSPVITAVTMVINNFLVPGLVNKQKAIENGHL
jgi:hypothetical protein